MKIILLLLILPISLYSQNQKVYLNNISDPPPIKYYNYPQYKQVDSLKLDTSYIYEYFKLENEDIYLIRIKKKKLKK